MQDMLNSLSTYGYIILFFYSLGGGMVAIIAAGVLSYAGKMDLSLSITIAFLANALGDTLLFYLTRYNKKEVYPYIKKHRRKIALCHILMKKYGDKIIFFQKFIYGIKTLIPMAIGLTKYSFLKFNILNFISALIWSLLLGLGSFYSGKFFIKLVDIIAQKPWIMPFFIMGLLSLIWLYFQKTTKKRKKLYREN